MDNLEKKEEIKDIFTSPEIYFKDAIREAKLRSKLCELYSTYFEDLASLEEAYSKNIAKVFPCFPFFHSFDSFIHSFFLIFFRLVQIIV